MQVLLFFFHHQTSESSHFVVTCAGFHTEEGGAGILPTEILKLSMVINVLSQVLSNNLVPDCNPRGSKFKIFLWGRGLGACPQTPLVGTHTHACVSVCEHAFARYYHPATTMFPPPSKLKILYETLMCVLRPEVYGQVHTTTGAHSVLYLDQAVCLPPYECLRMTPSALW